VASFGWLRGMTDSQIQLAAQEQTLFLETIRGARAFKLFGREIDRHAVWQIANVEAVNAGLRLSRAGLVGGWRGGSNCGAWRTGTRRTSPGWCVMST
jgi:ATP-binding cassette subfamily B protein RaxB